MKLLLALFVSISLMAPGHAGELGAIDGVELKSLSVYDGLETEILGPMDIPMPKSFFTKNLADLANNGYNWVASFTINAREGLNHNLLLQNLEYAGIETPLTVAIELPNGAHRNFIAKFDENGSLALNLSQKLSQIMGEIRNAGEYARELNFQVTLISNNDFEGYNYNGSRFAYELEVEAPVYSNNLRATPFGNCCGPNMSYYNSCIITAENGVSALAYYKLTTVNESGGTCNLSGTSCRLGRLRVDYPNAGNPFHTSKKTTFCKYTSIATHCITPMSKHYTENRLSPWCEGKVQEHTWTGMVGLFNNGSTATIKATSGCQKDGTWTVHSTN